ncbi:hypothetical protein JZO77_22620 [Enterococcus hulanensis]|uniref:hypothetical protein n=1 Tax=Enterococcus hulanensis TaxID=2559929 RepID=UPI001A9059FA|nr:hypothetical protein [Enterococcus hulanensis]MBO0459536.1 hypothetical protein [Enterococcus hulanensis]
MKKQIEIQKENVKTLLDLIRDNPDLRVLPMVDEEVVASDEFSSWAASFGNAEIDYTWNDGERIYFKSSDEEQLVEKEIDKLSYHGKRWERLVEEEAEMNIKNLAWEKVIAVWIGLP